MQTPSNFANGTFSADFQMPARPRVLMPFLAGSSADLDADKVPGAYVWLGIGGPGTDSGLHTPTFRMDEAQLSVGAALHAAVALRALALQQHYSGREEL